MSTPIPHNLFRVPRQVVNIRALERFDADATVDAAALAQAGLVSRRDRPVKILSEGELAKPLRLVVDAISAAARKKVEAAGGQVEIVPRGRSGPAKSDEQPKS